MATNAKPVYQRILLKLSGEALQGSEGFGIVVIITAGLKRSACCVITAW
jgi:uridylate kinase